VSALAFGFANPRARDAWAEFSAKADPVFPSETKYRQDLISKWTRNGVIPTLERAEEMEAAEYAYEACLEGQTMTDGD
jgi:hypothetical protein